jgi:uncharacterized protein YyaL (SSP411 family)
MPDVIQNHLAGESSPYLLQHARNPVDWYPWGASALEKAHQENKLLLISIGYAACHWCHVMERESFSDPEVAGIMNRHFVSIKVDREERPDIDQLYMNAAYVTAGRGGWPLNVIAMPDQQPVFAGTYFPRDRFLELLRYFTGLFQRSPDMLRDASGEVMTELKRLMTAPGFESDLGEGTSLLEEMVSVMEDQFDREEGGTRGSPKFPMPSSLTFLMEYSFVSGRVDIRDHVLTTLNKMASGGIYDQLGGGFSRYSTDARWRVPHFEKMLYDNAQLLSLYSDAYRMTGEPWILRIVGQTADFVHRELTSPKGLFWSSLDADSEGEEGTFYTWKSEEFDRIMAAGATWAKGFFSVTEEGNWEEGKNILYHRGFPLSRSDEDLLEKARRLLFEYRVHRVCPATDTKILTSWNALMITGYLDAYRGTGNRQYLQRAVTAALFFSAHLAGAQGSLHRSYTNGIAAIPGFLDDHTALLTAFLSLYEVTFEPGWLVTAEQLARLIQRHFSDTGSGLFRYAPDNGTVITQNLVETSDDVIPASNSMLAMALERLGRLTGTGEYRNLSLSMLRKMIPRIRQNPAYHANWCRVMMKFLYPGQEIFIVGPGFDPLHRELLRQYLPGTILSGGISDDFPEPLHHKNAAGRTLIYVCRGNMCQPPVETVLEALELWRHADESREKLS